MMADLMPKKNYDLTEITRLLLEMRENCIPKAGDVYEDPNRTEKYNALNAAIDLINNPSMISRWISVKDRLPEDCIDQSKDVKQIKVMVAIKAKNGWTVRTRMRCKDVHSRFCGASPDIIWYWRHFSAGEITHWMPLPEPPKEEA